MGSLIDMGEEEEKKQQVVVDVETGSISDAKAPNDGDLALALAKQSQGIVIDEETNRRLLRKVDFYICPLMMLVYAIQYMDKISNSGASVMGLIEDLNMEGTMYNWTGTGFYLGYLVFEIPASLMLQRFPVAKTCGSFICIWGFILAMASVPHNYAGFETLRVLLGMMESSVTPAFVIITAQWYRREEQFFRTTIWFGCNGIGTILGSAIAYGFFKREMNIGTPIAGWRLMLITIGVITIVLGVAVILHIPDTPAQAWFLNEQERLQVVERIRDNKQGFGNRHFKKDQLIETITDIRTYLLFFYCIASNVPNGGTTNFGSLLLTGLGFTNERSLLMNMPGGAIEFIVLPVCGFIARRVGHFMIVGIITACLFQVLPCCLLAWGNDKAQLAGYMMNNASPVSFVCMLSSIGSNTAGHTKKVLTNAVYLIGYCVGNLIGPLTFMEKEAPRYTSAKLSMAICSIIMTAIQCVMLYVNWAENRRRDKKNEKLEMENSEFADLTDKQNPEFRYLL
jgi:ACS family allantoate permease-like MFS transporter